MADRRRARGPRAYRGFMTEFESPIPRFHLAMPVDDLYAARRFYGAIHNALEFKAFTDDSQVFAA